MTKKEKSTPPIIVSREAMESVVADVVRLKLERAGRQAIMEGQIASLTKKHEPGILELDKEIERKEAGVYLFCTAHRATLFPKVKSIETLLATVGFELTPHSVEKRRKGDTWPTIAKRLLGLDWGKAYVREADPEVDKNALKNDRTKFTEEQLAIAGIKIEQDEIFFIRPKSEVAEATTVTT
jgi:phage host-nuclease inhibitor protein Gam